MVKFDSAVIQQFADHLYVQANRIVRDCSIVGTLLGFIFLSLVGLATKEPLGILICALLGGTIGFYIGRGVGLRRAFSLKLQAQVALCQVEIESNTRGQSSISRAA